MGSIGPESKKQLELVAQAAAVGLVFVGCIGVGYGLGYLLDGWLATKPYCAYGGFILGVIAGFTNLYRFGRAASRASGSQSQQRRSSPNDSK